MEQIRATALFKHIVRWLDSEMACCSPYANLDVKDKDMLPSLAESLCCQGVDLLTGSDRLVSVGGKCCSHQINVQQLHADSENPAALVSGTVKTGNSEQGFDVLVPLCQRGPNSLCVSKEGHCMGLHPSTADVLTVLLLALPLSTWSGIKEEKLRVEVTDLVTTENLQPLLQEEVVISSSDFTFMSGYICLPWPL